MDIGYLNLDLVDAEVSEERLELLFLLSLLYDRNLILLVLPVLLRVIAKV